MRLGGKVKDIVSKEKSSNQILDLRYKDEAGESKSPSATFQTTDLREGKFTRNLPLLVASQRFLRDCL